MFVVYEVLRSYYSTVEMVIPPTYLYYYYYYYLRLRFYSSSYYYQWFPVYYPVTKNVRVSWKNLEKEKVPDTQILRKIPYFMANLLLLLPENQQRGYFYRSPFLGVRAVKSNREVSIWAVVHPPICTTSYYLMPIRNVDSRNYLCLQQFLFLGGVIEMGRIQQGVKFYEFERKKVERAERNPG